MSLQNQQSAFTFSVKGVNLNAVGDTATPPVPFKNYIIRRMTLTNASTSLGASAATIGAYTAVAAGGTALVTPATATGLTAASKFTDRTIAASADTQAGNSLPIYIRVGVVHGSAATCDVYFELQCVE